MRNLFSDYLFLLLTYDITNIGYLMVQTYSNKYWLEERPYNFHLLLMHRSPSYMRARQAWRTSYPTYRANSDVYDSLHDYTNNKN